MLAKADGSQVPKISREFGKASSGFLIQAGAYSFAVESKLSGAAAPVAAAIEQLKKYTSAAADLVPVVAVPYMGEVGAQLCAKDGVSWIDLSGNAHLEAKSLLVHVEGRPNLFVHAGRPADVFAPKSSRIVRALLANCWSAWSVERLGRRTGLDEEGPGIRELASSVDMEPGFTSRIVHRLEAEGLIAGLRQKSDGRLVAVRATNPDLLLDAWRDEYKFFRHNVLQGHVPVRSSDELLKYLDQSLKGIDHAATGLGAAWLFTHFAAFRLVTFYVRERPEESFLRKIGFREDSQGANVWLVIPNDDGVFQETRMPGDYTGAKDVEGKIRCVHPVQVYVDLKQHPERAAEAAAELRGRLLRW
ncbi:MAG: type IV toxin-antitoxin system AbiEi family antitoxin [Candidatus Binataceae bacterium]